MKNIKTLLISLILVLTTSANAKSNDIMEGFYETSNSPLVFSPLVTTIENNQLDHGYTLACYGCLSESTGRPRTEYVRPHYRSNGTYVDGYYRS